MNVKYDDMTLRERNIYAKGWVGGICSGCLKRSEADDYAKIPGRAEYCTGCKKKERVEFVLNHPEIDL